MLKSVVVILGWVSVGAVAHFLYTLIQRPAYLVERDEAIATSGNGRWTLYAYYGAVVLGLAFVAFTASSALLGWMPNAWGGFRDNEWTSTADSLSSLLAGTSAVALTIGLRKVAERHVRTLTEVAYLQNFRKAVLESEALREVSSTILDERTGIYGDFQRAVDKETVEISELRRSQQIYPADAEFLIRLLLRLRFLKDGYQAAR